jgi:murein DD-endopeptidase MepM/ murein hydrolase activator NlpD
MCGWSSRYRDPDAPRAPPVSDRGPPARPGHTSTGVRGTERAKSVRGLLSPIVVDRSLAAVIQSRVPGYPQPKNCRARCGGSNTMLSGVNLVHRIRVQPARPDGLGRRSPCRRVRRRRLLCRGGRPAGVVALVGVSIWSVAGLTTPVSATGAMDSSRWDWPISPPPPVQRGFDAPYPDWQHGHRGVDLGGHVGTPITSIGSGRVSFVGNVGGRDVIVVDHGALRSTYQPVLARVHEGQHVEVGQLLGTLELTGSHCLPQACLHLGVLRGSTYLDPLSLFGGLPVRLLPTAQSESQTDALMVGAVDPLPQSGGAQSRPGAQLYRQARVHRATQGVAGPPGAIGHALTPLLTLNRFPHFHIHPPKGP